MIRYLTQERLRWSYILEKAPWWGGFYERLVKSLKSSLKKTAAIEHLNSPILSNQEVK